MQAHETTAADDQDTLRRRAAPAHDPGGPLRPAPHLTAHSLAALQRAAGNAAVAGLVRPVPVAQRVLNQQAPAEQNAIAAEYNLANLGTQTPEQQADYFLASQSQVFWYGREPRTDEQIEVSAGAKYLHHRKTEWRQELAARQNAQQNGQVRPEVRPAWEALQNQVAATQQPQDNRPPWFLDPAFGAYQNLQNPQNQQFLNQAQQSVQNPALDDPQQRFGATYARDTMYSRYAQATAGDRIAVTAANFTTATLAAGKVLRLFQGPPNELRISLTQVAEVNGNVSLNGTVLVPAFGLAAGDAMTVSLLIDDSLQLTRVATGDNRTLNAGSWSAEADTMAFYQAVVLPEDSLGLRGQNTTTDRNRTAVPQVLDDTMMSTVRGRYTAGNPLDYAHSLGPARNPLNVSQLGWDVSVAPYRRLGGDSIFAEAPHPGRDPQQYSNRIQPPGAVDVTQHDWYQRGQEHNPDRFVGGRSNSTLNYMQTASRLFQDGRLTAPECLDVAAFVIADMVVSGEHSMQECMTTVAMVAQVSPPWNTQGHLLIAAPTETLRLWLGLVENATGQAMYQQTRQALVGLLRNQQAQPDFTLLKVLVALGKQLHNYF